MLMYGYYAVVIVVPSVQMQSINLYRKAQIWLQRTQLNLSHATLPPSSVSRNRKDLLSLGINEECRVVLAALGELDVPVEDDRLDLTIV